jgi:hypothetical protein
MKIDSKLLAIVSVLFCALCGGAWAQKPAQPTIWWTDVKANGAKGDGVADDTAAIRKAIAAVATGGVVYFPPGNYRVTDQITIARPVNLAGVGRGSQVYQATDGRNLFAFQRVQAVSVKDLYLGSVSDEPGTSLLLLEHSHHNRIDNVTMLGGYYGVHLKGSLLNHFVGLRSGTNFRGFFTPATSGNQYWVYAERAYDTAQPGYISANANTFLHPALEGGTHGIWLADDASSGQGSVYVFGGTVEGVAGYGIYFQNTGLPSVISGVHLEANALGDIYLQRASRVRIESVYATTGIELADVCTNNAISESLVERVTIGSQAVRTRLVNVTHSLNGAGGVTDATSDTQYVNVSYVNPLPFFSTIGIGEPNPNSSTVTGNDGVKLEVSGIVKAQGYYTGDIHFHKDGKKVWRMFEDEHAIYLESQTTGEVSRVFLERDVVPLRARLDAQQTSIEALRRELDELRAGAVQRP